MNNVIIKNDTRLSLLFKHDIKIHDDNCSSNRIMSMLLQTAYYLHIEMSSNMKWYEYITSVLDKLRKSIHLINQLREILSFRDI